MSLRQVVLIAKIRFQRVFFHLEMSFLTGKSAQNHEVPFLGKFFFLGGSDWLFFAISFLFVGAKDRLPRCS